MDSEALTTFILCLLRGKSETCKRASQRLVFAKEHHIMGKGRQFVVFLLVSIALILCRSFSFELNKSPLIRSNGVKYFATAKDTTSLYNENVMNTYGRYPLTIERGEGVYLFDDKQNKYIDCAAGIATCCLGHAHPKLSKAVSDQMNRVHHCSNLYFIPEQAQLASWLVNNSCAEKVFFCNSGAESNEAAIKLSRKYAHTKLNIDHPVIITAVNSFHGRTLTAITATGQAKYQKDFGPLTPGFEYVEYNNVEELKAKVKEIQARGNGHGLAAIMMETLQGEGGIRPGTHEYFREIRNLCDSTGALMIVDEVQTGMGRTGSMWGYEQLNIEPDVFTSAKALGGGVPIGAMLCKEKFNVFGPGDHASTYGGNPLACAAGVAVAKAFDEDNILENVRARGEQFRQLARAVLQKKYPQLISDVRGWGLINGIELAADQPWTAADVTKILMQSEHVLVVPAGPKVIRFVPPLIMDKETIENVVHKVDAAIASMLAQK